MAKALKILLVIIAALVVLLIAGAIIATRMIDPQQVKQIASEQVAKQTGRTLTIEGDVEFSFFPWVSVDLGRTTLSNAPGFGDQPMIAFDQLSASLKLLPLLSRKVEIDTVTLNGLRVNLQTDRDGRSNLDDLSRSAGTTAPSTADADPASSSAGLALAGLTLGGIKIADARIAITDLAAGSETIVDELDLVSGQVIPGQPVELSFSARVDTAEPELTHRISADLTMALNDELTLVTLDQLKVALTTEGETIPGGKLKADLTSAATVDLIADTLTVSQLQLQLAELKLIGELYATAISSEPAFSGQLSVPTFDARKIISQFSSAPLVTADDNSLSAVQLKLNIAGDGNNLVVTSLAAVIDETHIDGKLSVDNFAAPAIVFTLMIDDIDVDRYLPPATEGGNESVDQTATGEPEPLNLAETLAGLALLDVDGSLTIGKLKVAGIRSSEIKIVVRAKDHRLSINPLSANLYQGNLSGSVLVNGAAAPPRISVKQKLADVELAPLLTDLAGTDKVQPVSGSAHINLDLTTQGNNEAELTEQLNGNLGFEIRDGTVSGFNVDRSVCLAQQQLQTLKGEAGEACPADEPTRFTMFRASARVVNGVAANDDLFIEQSRSDADKFLHITGKGKADLNQQQIDYRVTASSVRKLAEERYETRGTPIPVKITGPIDSPSVTPDVSSLIKTKAKSKIQEKLDEKLAPAEDDSPEDQLKKQLLRGFFN